MLSSQDIILFDLPGSKAPITTRKVHIQRLYDVLQLCLLRRDLARARRAWAILARCKEVHWKTMWKTGVLLLDDGTEREEASERDITGRVDYLSTMMLHQTEDKESILQELILQLIRAEQYRRALDEIELYIPSPPYDTNPVLHLYAGLLCLYLSQARQDARSNIDHAEFNSGMLRDAQVFFERARILDPDNEFASGWIERIPSLSQQQSKNPRDVAESDEEFDALNNDDPEQRSKRIRL